MAIHASTAGSRRLLTEDGGGTLSRRYEPRREKRADRLAQYDELARFSRAISIERNFDSLLEFIAREAAVVMYADRASIFLLDVERGELWSRVALGIGDQVIRFPADRGIAGHVVSTGELLNISEPYEDDRFNPAVDRQTGYRTQSILCAPLRARDGRIIGAFQVLNKIDGPFVDEDEHLAETLASQASAAIENAQLYQQLRMVEQNGAVRKPTSPKLLFATSDPALVSSTSDLLGSDFQLVQGHSWGDVLTKSAAERFDLILLDVRIPDGDGFELCRALRQSRVGHLVPIIMVSGSYQPEDAIHAFESGANDYVVKPFSPAQLRAKAQTWLLRTARPIH